MIVTPYSHVLYPKMQDDSFPRYIARREGGGGPGGEGYSSAHAHIITCHPLLYQSFKQHAE